MSTVIVFAVLLFLSYENLHLTTQNTAVSQTEKTCRDVATDFVSLTSDDNDDDSTILRTYLRSELYADNGQIYIVDKNGNIYYSNFADAEGSYIDSQNALTTLQRASISGTQETVTKRTTTDITVISAMSLGDSGYICLVAKTTFLDDVFDNFVTVVLYPTVIALVAAIILFVGFVGLTVRPIKEISKTVSKVSEGDLTARIDSKYTEYSDLTSITISSDMAEMAKTINDMIETLENQENDRSIFISKFFNFCVCLQYHIIF